MFIATALSLRGEDIILSSSPQEAAHLIAKLQAGICREGSGQPEKESDKVLQQFLQRRQKANPSEAAR